MTWKLFVIKVGHLYHFSSKRREYWLTGNTRHQFERPQYSHRPKGPQVEIWAHSGQNPEGKKTCAQICAQEINAWASQPYQCQSLRFSHSFSLTHTDTPMQKPIMRGWMYVNPVRAELIDTTDKWSKTEKCIRMSEGCAEGMVFCIRMRRDFQM